MQAIDKIVDSNNWVTLLLLLLLVGVFVLKTINPVRLKQNAFAFFNISLISNNDKSGLSFFNPFQVIIFIFSSLVFSLFVFQYKMYVFPKTDNKFIVFVGVFGTVLSYLLTKRVLEYVLTLLFLIKKGVNFYMISKINSLNSVSFLLYIALVISVYTNINQVYIIYFAIILFVIRFVILLIRNKKLIFSKLFYFFLYLCAFEIAPLFVLYKLMF